MDQEVVYFMLPVLCVNVRVPKPVKNKTSVENNLNL